MSKRSAEKLKDSKRARKPDRESASPAQAPPNPFPKETDMEYWERMLGLSGGPKGWKVGCG